MITDLPYITIFGMCISKILSIILLIGAVMLMSWLMADRRHMAAAVDWCDRHNRTLGIVLLVAVILSLGLAPSLPSMADRQCYIKDFNNMKADGSIQYFIGYSELLFGSVLRVLAFILPSVTWYLLLIAAAYSCCYYFASWRMVPQRSAFMFAMVTSVFFFAYGTGVIRQGLAEGLVVAAIMLPPRRRWWLQILLMLVAVSLHKTVLLIVISYWLVQLIRSTRALAVAWIAVAVASAVLCEWFSTMIATHVNEPRIFMYLSGNPVPGLVPASGFRVDFVIYSAAVVGMGVASRYLLDYKDKIYISVVNTFMVCNMMWLVMIDSISTDRIAHLSWCLAPFVIFPPLIAPGSVARFAKLPWCNTRRRAAFARNLTLLGAMAAMVALTIYLSRNIIKLQ